MQLKRARDAGLTVRSGSRVSREQELVPGRGEPGSRGLQSERLFQGPPHELLKVIRDCIRRDALPLEIT
jgi:hypothetical protein